MSGFADRACARADRLRLSGDLARAEAAYVVAARASRSRAADGSTQAARVLARACVGLGRVHLARGEADKALTELGSARDAVADDADALYWEGCARGAIGDYAGAEQSLSAALAIESRSARARGPRGETRVQRACARFRAGDLDGALDDFCAAERLGALDAGATIAYAALCCARGECSETERLLAPLVDTGRRNLPAIRLLGFALERSGSPGRAADLYATAVDAADDDRSREGFERLLVRARRAQASALAVEKQVDVAVRALQDCIRLRPDDEQLAAALAALRIKAAPQDIAPADLDRVHAQLEHARSSCGTQPRLLLQLGLIEAARGRAQQALTLLADARAQAPDDDRSRRAHVLAAVLARAPGRAASDVRSCLAGAAPDAGAARVVAALLAFEGRWSAAADVLLRVEGGPPAPLTGAVVECLVRADRLEELERRESEAGRAWLALAELRRGRLEAAELLLSRTARDTTLWPAVARLCGLRRAASGDWKSAATHLSGARAAADGAPQPALLAEALVLALAGDHSAAISALETARDDDPSDERLAHCLALARFHALSSEDANDGADEWERAIAAWVRLTRDESFWEAWGIRAEQRRGDRIARHALRSARQHIDHRFETVLTAIMDREQDAGTCAAATPRLVGLLWRECSAAEQLAASGGFPVPEGAADARVCGPLLVRELGWERAFGQFAAELAARARPNDDGLGQPLHGSLGRGRDDSAQAAMALVRAFSSLGVAQAMLALDRPSEALEALGTLTCPLCAAPSQTTPQVCAERCPNFDALNPGYAGFPDKAERLLHDACDIASQAHLMLGQAAVAAVPLDAEIALEHFHAAASIRAAPGEAGDVQRRMAEIVIGRSRALVKNDRLDDAVTLVEAMLVIALKSVAPDLRGQLAQLLTNRGIRAANAKPPNWNDAILGLREALSCNPQLTRAVVNLAAVLRGCAADHLHHGRWEAAARLQAEAVRRLDDSCARIPGHPELTEQLAQARREQDLIKLARSEIG
jgi:cellulose synthase operon protein C